MFNFDADFTDCLLLDKIKSALIRVFAIANQFYPRSIFFSFNLERPDWFLKPVGSNILNEISISKEVYQRKL